MYIYIYINIYICIYTYMTTTQTRTQTNMINTSVADTIVQATFFDATITPNRLGLATRGHRLCNR